MYRRPIRQVIVRIHVVVTNNRHNRGIRELFHYECGDPSNCRICYQHGRQGMSDKIASTEPKVSDCVYHGSEWKDCVTGVESQGLCLLRASRPA